MKKTISCIFCFSAALLGPVTVQAQIAREVIEQASEQIFRQATKKGATELLELGGEVAVLELLEQSAKEGGEQLVEKVTQYALREGPVALRVIRWAPSTMVRALDDLSPELRSAAMHAAEREPQLVTRLVSAHGGGALEVAARHPGVGLRIVDRLGEDGIPLGRKLTTDQSIIVARLADDISNLPAADRRGILQKIARTPSQILDYLEAHPTALKTTAGVAVVLAIKDEVIGDKGNSTLLPDGRVITKPPHPGLIERMLAPTFDFLKMPLGIISSSIAAGIAGWFGVQIIGAWKRQRIALTKRMSMKEHKQVSPAGEKTSILGIDEQVRARCFPAHTRSP